MTQLRTSNALKFVPISALFVGILAFYGLASAYGSAVSDAQQALNKAYNDYYTALKTGPEKSPAEQARLRNEIISPAERALGQAMQKDAMAYDPNKAEGSSGSSGGGTTFQGNSSSRAVLGNPGASQPTTSSADSAPIEASAPREIQFPGPLALPKASPSPAKTGAH